MFHDVKTVPIDSRSSYLIWGSLEFVDGGINCIHSCRERAYYSVITDRASKVLICRSSMNDCGEVITANISNTTPTDL